MNSSRNVGIADPKLDAEACAGKSTMHGFSVESTSAISSCFSNPNDCTDCRRSKETGCTLGPEHLLALPLASRKDGIEGSWARSSAVEHYVDIVGATGSIPVAPTIQNCKLGAGNESQEFTALAQIAAPQLSNRAPQGPGLCDQQAAEAFQGKAGLTPNPACSHPAKPCVDAVIRCCSQHEDRRAPPLKGPASATIVDGQRFLTWSVRCSQYQVAPKNCVEGG